MLNILKIYMVCIGIYHSYLKELKLVNARSLYAIFMIKKLCFHIRSLKQALIDGLILKKVHRVIQFNQEAWLLNHILI